MVASLLLWLLLGDRGKEPEEVHGFRLYPRSSGGASVYPQQTWFLLESTLLLGWLCRALVAGAALLSAGGGAWLVCNGEEVIGLILAWCGLLFLPAVWVVWDLGRAIYLVTDPAQGVVFRKEVYAFRRVPAEARAWKSLAAVAVEKMGRMRLVDPGEGLPGRLEEETDARLTLAGAPPWCRVVLVGKEGPDLVLLSGPLTEYVSELAADVARVCALPVRAPEARVPR